MLFSNSDYGVIRDTLAQFTWSNAKVRTHTHAHLVPQKQSYAMFARLAVVDGQRSRRIESVSASPGYRFLGFADEPEDIAELQNAVTEDAACYRLWEY